MEFLLTAIFLPLFPLSMVFNALYTKCQSRLLRILLLLFWPAVGVYCFQVMNLSLPVWVNYWAIATAILYALRSLAMRELSLWGAYIATSVWALLWIVLQIKPNSWSMYLSVISLSLPLSLIPGCAYFISSRLGGAYSGVTDGLATRVPRIALLLGLVLFASVASPLFPGFFTVIGMVNNLLSSMPVIAFGILLLWFIWSWSALRIFQGFVVGRGTAQSVVDLGLFPTAVLVLSLIAYVVFGLIYSGELL